MDIAVNCSALVGNYKSTALTLQLMVSSKTCFFLNIPKRIIVNRHASECYKYFAVIIDTVNNLIKLAIMFF